MSFDLKPNIPTLPRITKLVFYHLYVSSLASNVKVSEAGGLGVDVDEVLTCSSSPVQPLAGTSGQLLFLLCLFPYLETDWTIQVSKDFLISSRSKSPNILNI